MLAALYGNMDDNLILSPFDQGYSQKPVTVDRVKNMLTAGIA
jgi:hypothetical protein